MAGIAMREVKIETLRDLMEGLLLAAGCPGNSSKRVAHIFLEADLRGIHVQGLHLLVLSLLNWLRSGKVDPKGEPRIVQERSGSALVDGNRGLGQLAGEFAVDLTKLHPLLRSLTQRPSDDDLHVYYTFVTDDYKLGPNVPITLFLMGISR